MSKRKWCAILILALHEIEKLRAELSDSSSEDSDSEPEEEPKPKKRRCTWVKRWPQQQRPGDDFCSKLLAQLRGEESAVFKNFVRMTAQQFDHLLNLVKPHIQKKDTNMRRSISASDRLVLTLRYLATGDKFSDLQYIFQIPQTTISRIIPEVLDAIYKVLVKDYLKVPRTEGEWEAIAEQFEERWQFPHCIGAADGRHVVMFAPPKSGSAFCNYKGSHSIVLFGVADADYQLLYVDVGRNGCDTDGGVFNCCTFGQALETNQLRLPQPKALPGQTTPVPYVLVADDAFSLGQNIMKPYPQSGLTPLQETFNYRLSRPRSIIENVFGLMTARFRVLSKPIYLDAEKVKKVTLACCALHNYLIKTNKLKYAPSSSFDQFDAEGNMISPGEWRSETSTSSMFSLQPPLQNADEDDAREFQRELTTYFVEEGEFDWQYKHI